MFDVRALILSIFETGIINCSSGSVSISVAS